MSFVEELKRRNVFRVAVLYVVASWLVLQVVDVLSSILPVPDWTGSLVFILLVAGFLPVLIFSWVYELTPEGLKREQEVDRSRSITHETGRKMNVLIVVMLALAVGAVVLDRLIPERERRSGAETVESIESPAAKNSSELSPGVLASASDLSVVVLPFADLSPGSDQGYFSDGLADELLSLLTRVPGLTVTSRTSAFSFKGKDVTIAEVAETLNVRHVIEGSVRKSGDRIRVTVLLIDATRDVQLWSESWDRNLDDIFAVQNEIAARVVDELQVSLIGQLPTTRETDPEAYNLYLRARYLAREISPESMEAIELYKQAVAIDPGYAPAWNALSTHYIRAAFADLLPWHEGWSMARTAAENALSADPQNARANEILGTVALRYDVDLQAAAQYLEEAFRLAPNEVLNGVGGMLNALGRTEEAIAAGQLLLRRDPLKWKFHYNLGLDYYALGDFQTAEELFHSALALNPDDVLVRNFDALVACKRGRYQECLEAHEALTDLTGSDSWALIGRSLAYYKLGQRAEAARALARLERDFAHERALDIALIHAQQGRDEQALDWLQKRFDLDGPSGIATVDHYPEFRHLRDNPRYQALLENAGVSRAQLAAVKFNIDLPN